MSSRSLPHSCVKPGQMQLARPAVEHVVALLPKFNGANMPLGDWAKKVLGIVRAYRLSPEKQVEVAMSKLGGEARRAILYAAPQERRSLIKMIQVLEGKSEDPDYVHLLWRKLTERCQQENESIQHFGNALQELMAKVKKRRLGAKPIIANPEKWLKKLFIQGLRSAEVQKALQEMLARTPDLTFFQIQGAAVSLSGRQNPVKLQGEKAPNYYVMPGHGNPRRLIHFSHIQWLVNCRVRSLYGYQYPYVPYDLLVEIEEKRDIWASEYVWNRLGVYPKQRKPDGDPVKATAFRRCMREWKMGRNIHSDRVVISRPQQRDEIRSVKVFREGRTVVLPDPAFYY
ncbi:uncharacterized protein [Hyperolius riggenbachi]|uniref:uncharacterized protein n=1 Tax=Hyperolius riggenbachi TaxID=752182 RepID=UPI0035A2BCAD